MRYPDLMKCLLGMGVSLSVFSACVNQEYDLSKGVNTDITIGSGGISLPFGSTEAVKLSKLIKESDVIKLEDGFYSLRKSGRIDETKVNIDPVRFSVENFRVDPVAVDFNTRTVKGFTIADYTDNIALDAPEITLADIQFNPISEQRIVVGEPFPAFEVEVEDMTLSLPPTEVDCSFDIEIPKEIKKVERVYFGSERGQLLHFDFDLSSVVDAMQPAGFHQTLTLCEIAFPEGFELSVDPDSPYAGNISVNGNRLTGKNLALNPTVKKLSVSFYVKSALVNAPSGVLNYRTPVTYRVDYRFGGKSTGVPLEPRFIASFEDKLNFFDADIHTADIAFEYPASELKITGEVDDLQDISRVEMVTFRDSKLRLRVKDPGIPLPISAQGYVTVALPPRFGYALVSAPAGVKLEGKSLHIPGDRLLGALIDLEVKEADLSDAPIVANTIRLSESVKSEGMNLSFLPTAVKMSEVADLNVRHLELELLGGEMQVEDARVVTDVIETQVATTGVLNIDEKVPDELMVVHQVFPDRSKKTYLNLRLDFPAHFPQGVDKLTLENFEIHFPPFVRLNDPRMVGQTLVLNDSFDPKEGYRTQIEITGMDFLSFNDGKGIEMVNVNGEKRLQIDHDNIIRLSGTVKSNGATVGSGDLKQIVVTPVVSVDEMMLGVVRGFVDPLIDSVTEELALEIGEDLDFLKQDAVLNLHNPQILLHVENTMGVPLDMVLTLKGRDANGEEIANSQVRPIHITLDPATEPGVAKRTQFLISKQGTEREGYKSVRSEDLSNLLMVLPESISIEMEARANQDTPHEIDLSAEADKFVSADYEVVVPLRFDAIELNYVEPITDIGKELEKFADKQDQITIEVKTKACNTIPLDLMLTVVGKDVEANRIEGIVSEECAIKAGAGVGNEISTETTLKVVIAKDALPKLESLDLVIYGRAEETEGGVALHEEQYVQLTNVKLRVLGGITLP